MPDSIATAVEIPGSDKSMNRKAERYQVVLDEPCVLRATRISVDSESPYDSPLLSGKTPLGLLIINADDWGREYETTARTLYCALHQTITSFTAMEFIQLSEQP